MSEQKEEENVLAEQDVIHLGGCEAVLEERTFKVSRQRMTGHVPSYNYEPSVGSRGGQIMNASLDFFFCCIASFFFKAPADFSFMDNFLN